jgi:hypothetical protein
MASTDTGMCHYCRTMQSVHEVTDEQAAAIAEDAQVEADYYLMDEHLNPATEQPCQGVGKAPEWLYHPDIEDGNFLEPDDIEEP